MLSGSGRGFGDLLVGSVAGGALLVIAVVVSVVTVLVFRVRLFVRRIERDGGYGLYAGGKVVKSFVVETVVLRERRTVVCDGFWLVVLLLGFVVFGLVIFLFWFVMFWFVVFWLGLVVVVWLVRLLIVVLGGVGVGMEDRMCHWLNWNRGRRGVDALTNLPYDRLKSRDR